MKENDNVYSKERLVVLPEDSHLDDKIIERLDKFFGHTSPREIRDNVLEIYLNYITFCNEFLPADFEKIADNLYHLLKFLEYADKENEKSREKEKEEDNNISRLREEEVPYSLRRSA